MRKPIQICSLLDYTEPRDVSLAEEHYVPDGGLVALCDDGSIWVNWFMKSGWNRMDAIPQDDDDGSKT